MYCFFDEKYDTIIRQWFVILHPYTIFIEVVRTYVQCRSKVSGISFFRLITFYHYLLFPLVLPPMKANFFLFQKTFSLYGIGSFESYLITSLIAILQILSWVTLYLPVTKKWKKTTCLDGRQSLYILERTAVRALFKKFKFYLGINLMKWLA